jgi:HEAT repeat protein
VRREALLVLAKLGAQEAGPLIIGMLDDPDADVRVAAVMAAGELKLERALKPLLARLETKGDPDLQLAVLRALGQIGDPGAVNAIEKHAVGSFFSKPPTEVRIAAYRALHHIGTPRAKKLLGQAAGDKDPEVQAEVRELVGAR